ncbi:SDR family oxidoreductase, partial [Francisella tularensis subsp. holarctica]
KNHTVINIDIQQIFSAEILKFIKADLNKQQDITTVLHSIKNVSFDGIFLNAGILIKGSIFDIDIESIKKVLYLNVWSSIYFIKGLENNLKVGASIVFNGSDQC